MTSGREMDQKTIAKALGYSPSTVNNWFTGKAMPSVEQLEAISKKLNASAGWLAFGTQGVLITPDGVELPASPPADEPDDHRDEGKRGRR
jgi:transcriptional regulator with XRE-family HTH domain